VKRRLRARSRVGRTSPLGSAADVISMAHSRWSLRAAKSDSLLACRRLGTVLFAILLCGCGGGAPSTAPGGAAEVSTLAYVQTDCRERSGAVNLHQELHIRQQAHAPIVATSSAEFGPFSASGTCKFIGALHSPGIDFLPVGTFQRLGVSPDGSTVLFEVTDEFSLLPLQVPEASKGIFAIRADGSDLRRVGPASHEPPFFQGVTAVFPTFAFSPNGRRVVFTDRGPGTDGQDATQIAMLDIFTGQRTQITRLPPSPSLTCCAVFVNDDTIRFRTSADADGMHPGGNLINAIVNTDGTDLHVPLDPVPLPGSQLVPDFVITGEQISPVLFFLQGTPENDSLGAPIQEVFLLDGDAILQLTNFHRSDTYDPTLDADGEQVLFVAAADPVRANPYKNCQIFSVGRTGDGMRQLTSFGDATESKNGCEVGRPEGGCTAHFLGRDAKTGSAVFYSDCDPFATGVVGGQIFAMRSDGTGLQQLTTVRGYVRQDADGSTLVELPGPFAYPGALR
jgi:hypothetical protein